LPPKLARPHLLEARSGMVVIAVGDQRVDVID
jgi:hypothetical protein